MEEIWKDIRGYDGFYEVSNLGRVRSYKVRKRLLKQHKNRYGYLMVTLRKNRKIKTYSTHRLVAESFLIKIREDLQVNHKNGIKTDNMVQNLEWVTPLENVKHAWITGLSKPKKGEKNGRTKLTNKDVLEIRIIKNISLSKMAEKYGVSKATISRIKSKKSWKHI